MIEGRKEGRNPPSKAHSYGGLDMVVVVKCCYWPRSSNIWIPELSLTHTVHFLTMGKSFMISGPSFLFGKIQGLAGLMICL